MYESVISEFVLVHVSWAITTKLMAIHIFFGAYHVLPYLTINEKKLKNELYEFVK
jgi:hypothetical protein